MRVQRRRGPHRAHAAVCTPRFCAHREGDALTVEHDLTPDELSDELAVLLTEELGATGVLHGQPDFESVFTGVVRSTVDGGMQAWLRFYRNSLHALESGTAAFAPIHQHATELIIGRRVLDLGSCFGFFPLRLSRNGFDATATDLSAPTMNLLARVSPKLHRPVRTVTCDAAGVPLPDAVADTVTALHLLEHLDPDAGDAVLAEALRLARRRVIVAVRSRTNPRSATGTSADSTPKRFSTSPRRSPARTPSPRRSASTTAAGWYWTVTRSTRACSPRTRPRLGGSRRACA